MAKLPRATRATPPQETDGADDADTVTIGQAEQHATDLKIDPRHEDENWDLPPGETEREPPESRQPVTAEQDERVADPYADADDERLAIDDDDLQGQNAPRQGTSHRARRNRARRAYSAQNEQEILRLQQRLDEQNKVIEKLVGGQAGQTIQSVDGQISQMQNMLQVVNRELAAAVNDKDGAKFSEAQEVRDQLQQRIFQAQTYRQRLAEHLQAGGAFETRPAREQQTPATQEQPQVDPRIAEIVESKFAVFQDRFPWFDPRSNDPRAEIVRAVSNSVQARGLPMHVNEFWHAVERELGEKFDLHPDDAEGDEEVEVRQRQPVRRVPITGRPVQPRARSGPPTGSVRGTARGNGRGFDLSEEQTNILRDEGLMEPNLSDQDKAKRERIISKWRAGAAELARAGRG